MSKELEQQERKAFMPENGQVAQETEGEQEEKKKRIKREIWSWVGVLLFSLVLAWFIGNFVIMNAYIPSESMTDTLQKKDRLIGFRLSYLYSEPERGDIIMFVDPDDESRDLIKRVIGLPGETVTIKRGKVYIDGSNIALEEDYLKEPPLGDYGPFEVPEGCYFVMGDNRNDSHDSRYWTNKYVKKEQILAKAIVRWYPFNKMRLLTN